MSYYNPEVYNYEALKPEDRRLVDVYDFAVGEALNREFIMDDRMGLMTEKDTIIGQMKREIAEEVFDCIEEYLAIQRLELIVSLMDSNENYYAEDPKDDQ